MPEHIAAARPAPSGARRTPRPPTMAASPTIGIGPLSPAGILQMQQTMGNRMVGRLLGDPARAAGGASVARMESVEGVRVAIIQRDLPKKAVSSTAMGRLRAAKDAIKHTKSVFMYGAGNQREALEATQFNSYFRLKVMRNKDFWKLTDEVQPLAAANPDALTAAKADLVHGGNCGEHARVAFDYLRVNAVGETLNRSAVAGLDHAFIIMGNLGPDADNELVVADPWPTQATATVWEDHFAFTDDRSQIKVSNTMAADGQNVKAVIAAGLTLTDAGKQAIQQKMTKEETAEAIEEGTAGDHPWIWDHAEAAAQDRKFDYIKEGLQSPRFAGDARLEAAYKNAPAMRKGEAGPPVTKIQQALVDDGFPMPKSTDKGGSLDGIFGWETRNKVYKFQEKHGLPTKDGVVGRETMGKLDELYR